MVPLPVQAQFLAREVITFHDSRLGHTTSIRTHHLRHLSILIAQLWPTVNPANGTQRQHTTNATTILEHDTIPVALRGIHDGTLCQIREATEVRLQHSILLPGAIQVLGAIAHLTTMTARGIDMRDKQSIISTIVLDDTCTLQQSTLIGLTLEIMTQRTFHNTFQVACQLTHLACSEENIWCAILVKEQGGIMKMAQTGMDSPRTLRLLCRKDIRVAHRAWLIGSQ